MTEKPTRLGRGLEALFSQTRLDRPTADAPTIPLDDNAGAHEISIATISPNPYQPRREFSPSELTELENSLRVSGLLQPITVRPSGPNAYQLVAGERRLRAATRLGWTSIPAVVRAYDDQAMLVVSLVENLQRADLPPLDEAHGYRRLIDEFHLTPTQIASAVGKDRSTVANLLRVLTLPAGIQTLLQENRISLGHARALLALPNERTMIEVARQIVDRDLSVRAVERQAQAERVEPTARARARAATPAGAQASPEVRRLTELFRRRLQTDVRVQLTGEAKGEVCLAFYSADDLHRLAELILGRSPDVS
jgi:ParB family chromosome partitioning protein